MRLTLQRLCELDGATVGRLTGPDLDIFTIERPWLDNAPSVSCVPPGFYVLEPHSSTRFPDTWALVGDTVSHYADVVPRSAILFHAANEASELQGCIAPCYWVRIADDGVVGHGSRDAMGNIRYAIRYAIGDATAYLTINAPEMGRGGE